MFNSREYQWSDVNALVGGRPLTRLRGIRYKRSMEKELLYGTGNEPVSIQRGNVAYEGEITMLQSEYQALVLSGGGSVLGLQLDVVVTYGNPALGDMMVADKLLGCQFTDEEVSMSQGDKNAEITLPFIFLRKISV